jgi:peptidyl-prolyl cis-trans isomerase D
VTDKQDGIRLATVALRLEAQKLLQIKFTQATKFEIEATEKDFNVVAKEMGLTVVPGISVSAMDENFGPR